MNGRGVLWIKNKRRQAHRVAYELSYGSIPPGQFIRHTCGNLLCCRPVHLYAGNVAENAEKGVLAKRRTGPIGTPSRGHKHLSRRQADEIRLLHRNGESQTNLATKYFVSTRCIWNILHGRSFA